MLSFFLSYSRALPALPSFPTRRSSDLAVPAVDVDVTRRLGADHEHAGSLAGGRRRRGRLGRLRRTWLRGERIDRKSTRLNSSHLVISYAVFCLKKKRSLRTCITLLSKT